MENNYGYRTEEGLKIFISLCLEGTPSEEVLDFFYNRLPTWKIPIDGKPINDMDVDIITDMVVYFTLGGSDDGNPHYLIHVDMSQEEKENFINERLNYDGSVV